VIRLWRRGAGAAGAPFDARFFGEKVEAALERRKALLASGSTDACRLIHGDGDGLPGINVDRWGEFLVLEAPGRGPAVWAPLVEDALERRLRPRGIVEKLVLPEGSGAAGRDRGKAEERVARGEPPPEVLTIREDGVPFAVRLLGARHEGLFTDMRDERRRLAALAPARVLNLFAYTGAFSVVAARAGAETTTVDIVAKVLDWAKENFRLSGVDPDRHHFARMDAGEFLGLAAKRGWEYDAVILDPPTAGVARGKRWSIARDYAALIARALRVLAPGGHAWVAANTVTVAWKDLDRWIGEAARAAGRAIETVARAGQPEDYPAPAGFPRYRYLKVHVLRG
jgi:23S rRNA (cytosine1962-C5)-methyltransferase